MSDKIPKEQESVWAQLVKDVVDVNKGLLFTLKTLVRHPDRAVKGYLADRSFYSPFKLLAFSVVLETSAIAAARHFFRGKKMDEVVLQSPLALGIEREAFVDFYDNVMPYLDFMYIVPITLFTWLLFRRADRPLSLFAVANSYLLATVTLLTFPLTALSFATNLTNAANVVFVMLFAYATWTYARLFRGRLLTVALKSVTAFILATLLFFTLLGTLAHIYAVL